MKQGVGALLESIIVFQRPRRQRPVTRQPSLDRFGSGGRHLVTTGNEEMAPLRKARNATIPILVFDVHVSVPCRPASAGKLYPDQ